MTLGLLTLVVGLGTQQEVKGMLRPTAAHLGFVDLREILGKSVVGVEAGLS